MQLNLTLTANGCCLKKQANPMLYMQVNRSHVWKGNIGPSVRKILIILPVSTDIQRSLQTNDLPKKG